jgi:cyclohexadienyl dehydratase
MRPILRLAAALLLLTTPTLTTQAQAQAQSPTRLDTILTRGTLRVGVPGDYAPFALKDASGEVHGIDIDMAQSLATAMGVKLEIIPTKWADLLPDVTADKFDIGMGGISITLARAKVAFFSTPTMRVGKSAIARCDAKAKFATLADIDKPGVKVITNPGGTNEKFDRATLKAADIVVFPTNTGIPDELIAGHADVMITDNVETRLQQKLHPELCAINPDKPFDFGELGYLLPRDVALQQYVDLWLHTAAETGDMAKITAKWLQ